LDNDQVDFGFKKRGLENKPDILRYKMRVDEKFVKGISTNYAMKVWVASNTKSNINTTFYPTLFAKVFFNSENFPHILKVDMQKMNILSWLFTLKIAI